MEIAVAKRELLFHKNSPLYSPRMPARLATGRHGFTFHPEANSRTQNSFQSISEPPTTLRRAGGASLPGARAGAAGRPAGAAGPASLVRSERSTTGLPVARRLSM